MDFLADSCLSTSVMVKSYKKPCQTSTRYHFLLAGRYYSPSSLSSTFYYFATQFFRYDQERSNRVVATPFTEFVRIDRLRK